MIQKLLYVSNDKFNLKKGQWYTLAEISIASDLPIKKIQDRVRRESLHNAFCEIVTAENLRSLQEKQFFKFNTIETPQQFISNKYLRRIM